MKLLKSNLLGANVCTETKQVYFYGGIFSQWAECRFYVPSLDLDVNCAEQAMMLHKAKMFEDFEAFERIRSSKDPSLQKRIGRAVKNFDPEIYNSKILDIVSDINYHKFSQNSSWKELLIFLDGYEFVEASPYDKIWGIGLGVENLDIYDRNKWNGTNWLGIAINNAQQRIINEL